MHIAAEIFVWTFTCANIVGALLYISVAKPSLPKASLLTLYYYAEPRLMPAAQLVLLGLAVTGLLKLIRRLGMMPADSDHAIALAIGLPMFIVSIAYLVLFVRAYVTLRSGKGPTPPDVPPAAAEGSSTGAS